MILKKRLKQLRKQKSVYQKEVAKFLGVALTTYAAYEQGTANPSLEILSLIGDYFDVSTDYLLGKSNIKHTQSESDFLKEVEVNGIEFLIDKYNLTLGDHSMTQDETRTLVKIIKAFMDEGE
jgi:transcriptional regulator with XRE-family HTH domain